MNRGRTTTRRCATALAAVVLPFIALAPVLSGVLLFHDHGSGPHVHRFAPVAVAAHPHPTSTGHPHHHGHRHDATAPEAPAPDPHGGDREVVFVVTQVDLGRIPTASPAASAAMQTPANLVATDDPERAAHAAARPRARHGAPPPRRGVRGLLATSHALLI